MDMHFRPAHVGTPSTPGRRTTAQRRLRSAAVVQASVVHIATATAQRGDTFRHQRRAAAPVADARAVEPPASGEGSVAQ
jgi:hypothetical protein